MKQNKSISQEQKQRWSETLPANSNSHAPDEPKAKVDESLAGFKDYDSEELMVEIWRENQQIRRLNEELHSHQTELEHQNEMLRLTQRQLEAAQSKYFHFYNFTPIGYFTFDHEGIVVEFNLTGVKLLNKERSSLKGKPFFPCLLPQSFPVFSQHLRRVFETEAPQTCELTLRNTRDGRNILVRLESIAASDGPEDKIRCRTAMIDITEQKQMEIYLQESRRLLQSTNQNLTQAKAALQHTLIEKEKLLHELQTHQIELKAQNEELRKTQDQRETRQRKYFELFDTAPISYFMFDKRGRILEVNRLGAKLLNRQPETLLQKPLSAYLETNMLSTFMDHIQNVLSSQEPQSCQLTLRRLDESQVNVWLDSVVAKNEQGKFTRCHTVMIAVDSR